MNKIRLFVITLLSICYYSSINNSYISLKNDISCSSLVDPGEGDYMYTAGKAFADVGIFPDRQFKGDGIKIGFIDAGIPFQNHLSQFNIGGIYNSTNIQQKEHTDSVASIAAGSKGIASNATVYFASYNCNSFEECLSWLKNKNVDIINYSANENINYAEGCYTLHSDLIDKYIKENNVVFIHSAGNKDRASFTPTQAMSINEITVGASSKRNIPDYGVTSFSPNNIFGEIIEKPVVWAPGSFLFGLANKESLITEDEASLDNFLTGTSFSAPFVTGIVALLMQEFPYLKGNPALVQSILKVSTNSEGIIDYQLARKAVRKCLSYKIENDAQTNDVLFQTNLLINQGKTLYANNFVMFNGLQNLTHPLGQNDIVDVEDIKFSKIKLSLERTNGQIVAEATSFKQNVSLQYKNDEYDNLFIIKVILCSNKPPVGIETASIAFRTENFSDDFEFNYTNYNLDTLPTFSWIIKNTSYAPGSVRLVFFDFKNNIVIDKSNLPVVGSLTLTLPEWHSLLGLQGTEFYVCLSAAVGSKYYYSIPYVLEEPVSYGELTNIRPDDYGFPQAYNNSVINSNMAINGYNIAIQRLRCGYIENQYINLSAKKRNAGFAYLQLVFDRTMSYLTFGITQWREFEFYMVDNDEARIFILNPNGVWEEFLDLFIDVDMPTSRKDVLRFDLRNVNGIRFETKSYSPTNTNNRGRLCIENISFTDNDSFVNDICRWTEPVVQDKTFGLTTEFHY